MLTRGCISVHNVNTYVYIERVSSIAVYVTVLSVSHKLLNVPFITQVHTVLVTRLCATFKCLQWACLWTTSIISQPAQSRQHMHTFLMNG